MPKKPTSQTHNTKASLSSLIKSVAGYYAEGCGVEWGFGSVAAVVVDFVFEVL